MRRVCLSKNWCLPLDPGQVVPAAGGTGVSVSPPGAPGVLTKGQEHCGSQSQWLVGTGLHAGKCLSLSSLNQVGVCVCACKLAIKWSSGWDTVKIWGSRVCWDASFEFICGADNFCPPLALPVFCLKPDTGSEESGVLRNVTVATQPQLFSQPKPCNR